MLCVLVCVGAASSGGQSFRQGAGTELPAQRFVLFEQEELPRWDSPCAGRDEPWDAGLSSNTTLPPQLAVFWARILGYFVCRAPPTLMALEK